MMVAGDGVEPPKIQVLSLVNYPLFYPAPEKIGADAVKQLLEQPLLYGE